MKMNYSHPHMTTNINKIPEKKAGLQNQFQITTQCGEALNT